MPPRKSSVYSKVNFNTLKKELEGIMGYLQSEKVDDTLQDEIDWKINQKGGVNPSIVSTIGSSFKLKEVFNNIGIFVILKNS